MKYFLLGATGASLIGISPRLGELFEIEKLSSDNYKHLHTSSESLVYVVHQQGSTITDTCGDNSYSMVDTEAGQNILARLEEL